MSRKIIEALANEMSKHVNGNTFTDKLTKKIEIPSYDVSIHFLTDGAGATEVLLIDKNSGEVFAKYLFPSQEAFNAYMVQAFVLLEGEDIFEQQGQSPRIIQFRL